MHNYIAVIFNDTGKAYKALHALWQLDGEGEITVHGATVVHRNEWGEFQVDTKETQPAYGDRRWRRHGRLAGRFGGTRRRGGWRRWRSCYRRCRRWRGWHDYGSSSRRHSRSSDR